MKTYKILISVAILLFRSMDLLAITHDDSESIIPELLITFKGTGTGTPSMTVYFDAYREYNASSGLLVQYTEITNKTGTGNVWINPFNLIINKGMPLDQVGTLRVEGQNIAEYKIFINTPDSKYQPYVESSEQYMIHWISGGSSSLPTTNAIFFKHSGDGGSGGGKASSAMPGWINYKMGLGYGKTGKSLGYLTFLNGNEITFPDTSNEMLGTNYVVNGVPHVILYSPAMNYDISFDPFYTDVESTFSPGAYFIRGYDNATQTGTPNVDINGNHYDDYSGIAAVFTNILNYAVVASPPGSITKIERLEGNLKMNSRAHTFIGDIRGAIEFNNCFSTTDCVDFNMGMPICFTFTQCFPSAYGTIGHTLKSFTYDWSTLGLVERRCMAISNSIYAAPPTTDVYYKSGTGVGTGTPGLYSFSSISSGRYEQGHNQQTLPSGNLFFPALNIRHDSINETSGGILNSMVQYYWQPGRGSHLKLAYEVEPSGSWTYYEYYDEFEQRGMLQRITRPYLDSPSNPQTNVSGVMVTEFTYTNNWDDSKTLPAQVITKLKGSSDKVISRTTYDYSDSFVNGQPVVYDNLGIWITRRYDYYGPGANDRTMTITKRFRPDSFRPFANMPFSEEHSDGTKTVWKYEAGLYNETTKTYTPYTDATAAAVLNNPSRAKDAAIRSWKYSCFPASAPGAVALGIDNSYVVPNMSTAEVTTRDKFGRVRKIETYVAGSTWELLMAEAHDYDIAGNLIKSSKLMDGEGGNVWVSTYEAEYTDVNGSSLDYSSVSFNNSGNHTGQKQYERDRDGGIKKFYYEEYGRVAKTVNLKSPDILGFNSPPATQVSYSYDADNRILTTSVGPITVSGAPDPNALVASKTFNLAGMPVQETSPGGYTSTTDYAKLASRQITKTLKGRGNVAFDRTVISLNYLDGRAKSMSGTGVVPEFHSYSVVNLNGTVTLNNITMLAGTACNVDSVGSSTSHSVRAHTNYFDWVGRVVRESKTNPKGLGPLESTNTYNSSGQLVKTATGGLAPILYEYDTFGQVFRSGIKLETGSPNNLNISSIDRVSEQTTAFFKNSDGWWEYTLNSTYPNDSTPLTISQTYVRRSNWSRRQIGSYLFMPDSEMMTIDASGNASSTISLCNRDHAYTFVEAESDLAAWPNETILLNGRNIYQFTAGNNSELTSIYDGFGRLFQTKTRSGTTELTYRSGSTEIIRQKAPDKTWMRTEYDPAGCVAWQKIFAAKSDTQPDDNASPGRVTRYSYNLRGQLEKIWGDVPYPSQNIYYTSGQSQNGYNASLEGQLYEQWSFNGGTAWNGVVWPSSPGNPNRTRFLYYPENGLLKNKEYRIGSNFRITSYTYNIRGDLKTRVWDSGLTTTYNYKEAAGANSGELASVDYSNSSETDLAYTYNRLGALSGVTDAAGSRSFVYRSADQQLDYQNLPAATYGTGLKLGLRYDSHNRNAGYWFGASSSSPQISSSYNYDSNSGRLNAMTSSLGTFTYTYLYHSSLISRLDGPQTPSGTFVHTRNYASDSDLMTDCSTSLGANSIPFGRFEYRYDDFHRLTKLGQSGQIYQHYGTGLALGLKYNDRDELLGTTNYLVGSVDTISSSTPVLPRRTFGFNYDTTGNRTSAQVDADAALAYVPNELGQYTSRSNPKFVEVAGVENKNSSTTAKLNGTTFNPALNRLVINGAPNDYFYGTNNRAAPTTVAAESISLTSTLTSDGTSSTETRSVVARPTSENFTYDNDGNLTDDAHWHYTYDSENRIKQIETKSTLLNTIPGVKLAFVYDFLGRRVKKQAYTYSGGSWSQPTTTVYLFEGFNLIGEFQQIGAATTLNKSYYWGLDMSGSIQGAGGIGGLLGAVVHGVSIQKFAAINDANGNVIGLSDLLRGNLAAEYEYTPFGVPLRAVGAMASINPWRFSTKYYDAETGLLNFGYRYYSPSLGRFINRDPKDELGRLQLTIPISSGNGNIEVWGYIGALVGTPGKSPSLTPFTSTGLDQSNERSDAGYRNSTQPGDIFHHRKGGPSARGNSPSAPRRSSGQTGANHPYNFVNNNPYGAIDPVGLIWNQILDNMFGTWTPDLFSVSYSSFFDGGSSFSWGDFIQGFLPATGRSIGTPLDISFPGSISQFADFNQGPGPTYYEAFGRFTAERDSRELSQVIMGKRSWDDLSMSSEDMWTKSLQTIVDGALLVAPLLDYALAPAMILERGGAEAAFKFGSAYRQELMDGALAAETTATRACWVGEYTGLPAAQAAGANILTLSPGAQAAFEAKIYGPMQTESAAWARGAVGETAPVYYGTGLGRTFWGYEFPELMNNLNNGSLKSITIHF